MTTPLERERHGFDFLDRLAAATNAHDVDAITACFTEDYRNDTPVHPSRGFEGNEQVRRNWTTILEAVPDLTAEVIRASVDGDVVWSEWEQRGTRSDGTAHVMRGVIIFGLEHGRASWARFFLESVDHDEANVDDAVRGQVQPSKPPATG